MKRRSFLTLLGAAPLAAKATAEAEMANQIGLNGGYGGINAGVLGNGIGSQAGISGAGISYEKRISGAANYIKMFGVPESIDRELRENTQFVGAIDPDIACKKSWSMSVKIMTQRQRNYERGIERMTSYGWQQRGREAVKNILGFDWPW